MRPDAGDAAYVRDMIEACERVAEFIAGHTSESYGATAMVRSAVERQIEIVGEAARRVSEELRARTPHVPWRPIIAQRHILAHEYGEIEHELIWRVATRHIPALLAQLRPVEGSLR
jgi:uncharacterized protein with HEPN domain